MIISYYIIIVAYLKGKRRQKRKDRSYLSEERQSLDFQFLMTLFYRLPPICCKIESSKAVSSRFRSDCL